MAPPISTGTNGSANGDMAESGEVQAGDLGVHRATPPQRGTPFPPRCIADGVCSFDLLAPDHLAYYADACTLARLLGFSGATDPIGESSGSQWFICDPASPEYGSAVPDSALANDEIFISHRDRALVELDGVWGSAARVSPPAAWEGSVRV